MPKLSKKQRKHYLESQRLIMEEYREKLRHEKALFICGRRYYDELPRDVQKQAMVKRHLKKHPELKTRPDKAINRESEGDGEDDSQMENGYQVRQEGPHHAAEHIGHQNLQHDPDNQIDKVDGWEKTRTPVNIETVTDEENVGHIQERLGERVDSWEKTRTPDDIETVTDEENVGHIQERLGERVDSWEKTRTPDDIETVTEEEIVGQLQERLKKEIMDKRTHLKVLHEEVLLMEKEKEDILAEILSLQDLVEKMKGLEDTVAKLQGDLAAMTKDRDDKEAYIVLWRHKLHRTFDTWTQMHVTPEEAKILEED